MKAFITAGLICLGWAGLTAAQEGRWVTFKTGRNDWGRIEHQMDMQSVRPEGTYRIFWARIWIVDKHQPTFFTLNEALLPLSRKYVVDCGQRRFGSRFVDSNDPAEAKRKASLKTMRWEVWTRFPPWIAASVARDSNLRISESMPHTKGLKRLEKFQPCGAVFAVMH
jgi:hypothetical protein